MQYYIRDGDAVSKAGLSASIIGIVSNFLLFLIKLYIGISSNSLAIYCDAVNNFGDAFACSVALLGFYLVKKLNERKSLRTQSLCTFIISLVITASGAYFVYNGLERILYPLPVTYTRTYAVILSATVPVKIIMGALYARFNKKAHSSILRALVLDSILDCFVTAFAVMSLLLVTKVNYALDGFFAVITGSIITVFAIKNIIQQSKFLIND